jgi:sensor histidine kinase YesM
MDNKLVTAINSGNATGGGNGRGSSLGLRNVVQRLEAEYRDQAHLRVESKAGEGTRVLISLPILVEDED